MFVAQTSTFSSIYSIDKTLTLRLPSPLDSKNDAATEKVAILPAGRSEPHLGRDKTTYSRIAEDIAHIMHVACSVGFHIKPRNFVDNIAGITNLIHLALRTSSTWRYKSHPLGACVSSVPPSDFCILLFDCQCNGHMEAQVGHRRKC